MRSISWVVFVVLVAIVAMSLWSRTADAGIGIAIAKAKAGSNTDVKYWIERDSTSTGPKMSSKARKKFKDAYRSHTHDWRSSPYTTHSGDLLTGYYILIKYTGADSSGERYTRHALGYGTTEPAALEEAKKELARRDWSWKRRMGYTVVKKGSF